MRRPSTRRQFLVSTGGSALAVTAGCVSEGTTGSAADTGNGTETTTQTPTPESLDDWLSDANGYDGDPRQYGPAEQPLIKVGERTDDGLAFDPPVIEISPMTNVRWDWTGQGGQQNVVALDGTFDSGRTNAQLGTSYHYFFETVGEHRYVSEPHRSEGMKGAVIVREQPSSGYPAVDEWLAKAGNFDGTVVDRSDATTATVTVGANANGDPFGFAPPALRVEPGTTVVWEWTGKGGSHNVVSKGDSPLDSGKPSAEVGTTYEHPFDAAGSFLYYCAPHKALGMRGAIIVE